MAEPGGKPQFSAETDVVFTLERRSRVLLSVYDVRGARVTTLVDRVLVSGPHRVSWNGRDARGQRAVAGVYFSRLSVAGALSIRKMILVR